MTLAIYVPPEKVTHSLFKKLDVLNEMMLEAFINFEVLDTAQKIYCDDERLSQFSLLITSSNNILFRNFSVNLTENLILANLGKILRNISLEKYLKLTELLLRWRRK